MNKKFFKRWAKMFFGAVGAIVATFVFIWGLAWAADYSVILAMGVFTLVPIAIATAVFAREDTR